MKTIILFLSLCVALLAVEGYGFYADNDPSVTPKSIEKAFEDAGFMISDNRDMNGPYIIQFGESGFDVYNLFTLYHKTLTPKIALKHDRYGLFVPQSIVMYQKKGEKRFHIAFLSAEAIQKITGIKDEPMLQEIEKEMLSVLQSNFKTLQRGEFNTVISKPQGELITRYEIDTDETDWEQSKSETEMIFEGELKPKGFTMAGFTDLKHEMNKLGTNDYNFYGTYSICKLKVIYTVAKTNPEAGVFAPCSLAVYMKKGSGKTVMEFPSIYNWISSLNITDKESIEELKIAQKAMEEILESLQ